MGLKKGFRGKVEWSPNFRPRKFSCVLFDFDGTLSLIREGWQKVMLPMFLEMLPPSKRVSRDEDSKMLIEDIMHLNGKQTIYQMLQLTERITERGGKPKQALWYKHEYLRRLNERIHSRLKSIKDGDCDQDEFLIHGSRPLLERLKSLQIPLYLASGTDLNFVKQEAKLLKIADYFGEHIYGAMENYKSFSKKKIIDQILRENGISGEGLLAFGDGFVEIENTKAVGGLAVAVASDEANNGSGCFDEWKKKRLMQVGADVIIPDYRDAECLLKILCKK